MPFRHPTCLKAPQCLLGASYASRRPYASQRPNAFRRPTCLTAPQCLLGTPHALWHPICLFGATFAFMAPRLPFGTHICLNGTQFAFWCPHLPFGASNRLLQAPSAFWLPIFFLKRPMTKCPAAKRGPGFKFPGCNSWMIQSSCATTNQLYQLLLQASIPRVRMCLDPSHHFVWAHKRENSLLDLPRGICFSDVPRKPNIWLGKHTRKMCPLGCLV